MKTRLLIIFVLGIIGFTGTAFASEYTGEIQLYLFDYLKDKPIAYIIDYKIDGYLRNAVVDFDSNTIIFEIKDDGVLTVEIPKTHFLPNNYFPTLLIDKVDADPTKFLTKDEECFKEYTFSVNQSAMIELIMDRSSDILPLMNKNILVNCQSKIDNEITDTFDFNTIFEDGLEYTIIDGKQYLSKTIKSSLSNLTHDETIFELSEIKFHLYDKREDRTVYPGMGMMGLRTPVLFEFTDGATKEISVKTIPTSQDMIDEPYVTIEMYTRHNWPEVGVVAGLTPSNQITKLLVFEKNISPHMQLQHGIESENISCKVNLELIQKYDGSPSCVKPETAEKLIQRGWVDEYAIVKCTPSIFDSGKECTSETIVVIGKNSTVTFRNTYDRTLNLVSDYQPFWNTGMLNHGEIYAHTFEKPGFYPFHEEPEPWRTGTIIVLSDDYDVDDLPSSRDYDFERMHINNACTKEPSFCFGIFENTTQIMIQCDYPIHGCPAISFSNYTEVENEN